MSEHPGTWQRVSVAEAADVLGVSTATVRRMIRRGQLEGERVQRPQGTAYVVRLPLDASGTRQPPGVVSRDNASAPALMAAWSETFLAPIMARMAEQEAIIREQAEQIGSLRAQLATLEAHQTHTEAHQTAQAPGPTRGASVPRWRRWLAALAGV